MSPQEYPAPPERVDIRELLTTFWVGVIQEPGPDLPEKLKAADALAKYILGDGKGAVARVAKAQPQSTADVLQALRELEEAEDDEDAES